MSQFSIYQPWLLTSSKGIRESIPKTFELALKDKELNEGIKIGIAHEIVFMRNGNPTIFISNQKLIDAAFNASFNVDLETIEFPCQKKGVLKEFESISFAFKEGLEIEGIPLKGILLSKAIAITGTKYYAIMINGYKNDTFFNYDLFKNANKAINEGFYENEAFRYYITRLSLALLVFFSTCPETIKEGLPLVESGRKINRYDYDSSMFDKLEEKNELKKIVYVKWHFRTLTHKRYEAGGKVPRTVFIAPYMKGLKIEAFHEECLV